MTKQQFLDAIHDTDELQRIAQQAIMGTDRDELIDWLSTYMDRLHRQQDVPLPEDLSEIISVRAKLLHHAANLRGALLRQSFYEGQRRAMEVRRQRENMRTVGIMLGAAALAVALYIFG